MVKVIEEKFNSNHFHKGFLFFMMISVNLRKIKKKLENNAAENNEKGT